VQDTQESVALQRARVSLFHLLTQRPFSGNIQEIVRIFKVVLVEAAVTVPGLGMLGTAPVHPRVAAVAVVEIAIWRAHNRDGEAATVLPVRFLDRETALHFFPAYRTNIARYFVLHGGSKFACPLESQSQDGTGNPRQGDLRLCRIRRKRAKCFGSLSARLFWRFGVAKGPGRNGW